MELVKSNFRTVERVTIDESRRTEVSQYVSELIESGCCGVVSPSSELVYLDSPSITVKKRKFSNSEIDVFDFLKSTHAEPYPLIKKAVTISEKYSRVPFQWFRKWQTNINIEGAVLVDCKLSDEEACNLHGFYTKQGLGGTVKTSQFSIERKQELLRIVQKVSYEAIKQQTNEDLDINYINDIFKPVGKKDLGSDSVYTIELRDSKRNVQFYNPIKHYRNLNGITTFRSSGCVIPLHTATSSSNIRLPEIILTKAGKVLWFVLRSGAKKALMNYFKLEDLVNSVEDPWVEGKYFIHPNKLESLNVDYKIALPEENQMIMVDGEVLLQGVVLSTSLIERIPVATLSWCQKKVEDLLTFSKTEKRKSNKISDIRCLQNIIQDSFQAIMQNEVSSDGEDDKQEADSSPDLEDDEQEMDSLPDILVDGDALIQAAILSKSMIECIPVETLSWEKRRVTDALPSQNEELSQEKLIEENDEKLQPPETENYIEIKSVPCKDSPNTSASEDFRAKTVSGSTSPIRFSSSSSETVEDKMVGDASKTKKEMNPDLIPDIMFRVRIHLNRTISDAVLKACEALKKEEMTVDFCSLMEKAVNELCNSSLSIIEDVNGKLGTKADFGRMNDLLKKKQAEAPGVKDPYYCAMCTKTFSRTEFYRHIPTTHLY